MVFGVLILQARPSQGFYLPGECQGSCRSLAGVLRAQPCVFTAPPLAFLKGPVSQGKLPQCSLPPSCLGEMGKSLLDLCEMHGSPRGCHPVGASFLHECQFREGKVLPVGSQKESLPLSESRTRGESLEISAPSLGLRCGQGRHLCKVHLC